MFALRDRGADCSLYPAARFAVGSADGLFAVFFPQCRDSALPSCQTRDKSFSSYYDAHREERKASFAPIMMLTRRREKRLLGLIMMPTRRGNRHH